MVADVFRQIWAWREAFAEGSSKYNRAATAASAWHARDACYEGSRGTAKIPQNISYLLSSRATADLDLEAWQERSHDRDRVIYPSLLADEVIELRLDIP